MAGGEFFSDVLKDVLSDPSVTGSICEATGEYGKLCTDLLGDPEAQRTAHEVCSFMWDEREAGHCYEVISDGSFTVDSVRFCENTSMMESAIVVRCLKWVKNRYFQPEALGVCENVGFFGGERTIGRCLDAISGKQYRDYELESCSNSLNENAVISCLKNTGMGL